MSKFKNSLKRIISMMLAVALLVTSVTFSGFSLKDVNAATAYYPTLNFNLGKLSSPNSHVGKLTYDGKQAEMCNITMSGEPVFCMLLNGSLSMHNAFYTADIDAYGKSYQKYFRGCVYYYEDINDEFSLNNTERYVVSQIMLWRILQIRNNGKSGTYNNIMTGFESTFKDVINYWGECNANKAWNEIKQVMQWVNNDYDKVDSKHVKLYLWTHEDGTQPLLRGDVEPYDERAYIAVQKTGEIDNANVNNAEFGIYSKKACDDDSLICKISTNKDGYAVTNSTKAKKLKAGTTYHIKETKAPAGSKINNKVYSVKTAEGNNSKKKAVKIDIVDEQQKVKIGVTKVDKDDNSKKLSGATFRIYQWNAISKTYETYKDYTTGANGKLTTDWFYYTKTNTGKFRIEEISAPTNYKKATFKRDIQIGDGNTDKTLEYTVENEKYPGWIEIHKAAFLDNKDVSDKVNLTATFSIYSDAACTKNVGSITTNSSGFGKSGDLKEGTYYVKETKWTGRLKPSFKEAQEVRVNSNATTNIYGKPGELAGQTPDSIGIKLIKADEENRLLAIEGAVFEIREWNGSGWTLKYTEKTNEAGVIEIPVEDNKLYYTEKNQGKFMITEVSAPSGYEKDDSPKYITIDDSNAGTTINLGIITNKPKGGSLEIKKVITDINGEKITDFPMDDDFLQITYALFTNVAGQEAPTSISRGRNARFSGVFSF